MPVINCINCQKEITNPDFKAQWYDEDYPNQLLGPLCEDCICLYTVCSACHGFFYYDKMKRTQKDVLCPTCHSSRDYCSICSSVWNSADGKTVDGNKVCGSCIKSKYYVCPICTQYHRKDIEDNVVLKNFVQYPKRSFFLPLVTSTQLLFGSSHDYQTKLFQPV